MALEKSGVCCVHEGQPADNRCTVCEKLFCPECLSRDHDKPYCAMCIPEGKRFNAQLYGRKGICREAVIGAACCLVALVNVIFIGSLFWGVILIAAGLLYTDRGWRTIKYYPNVRGYAFVCSAWLLAVLAFVCWCFVFAHLVSRG